ncbi:hypothetical protein Ciccas_000419 [Cichlidogyrus casuarinus]|uniref:Uncharacterized protein n=1 Tax=Cichlidogyrus casuarinus TaxID=1844966 RepID=A0ABD2QN84_9PLAT
MQVTRSMLSNSRAFTANPLAASSFVANSSSNATRRNEFVSMVKSAAFDGNYKVTLLIFMFAYAGVQPTRMTMSGNQSSAVPSYRLPSMSACDRPSTAKLMERSAVMQKSVDKLFSRNSETSKPPLPSHAKNGMTTFEPDAQMPLSMQQSMIRDQEDSGNNNSQKQVGLFNEYQKRLNSASVASCSETLVSAISPHDQTSYDKEKDKEQETVCNKYQPVTVLEDSQAIRAMSFHPMGHVYAIGSNSKVIRICKFPDLENLTEDQEPTAPAVLFSQSNYHRGTLYAVSWSPDGRWVATGSNDRSVRLLQVEPDTGLPAESQETEEPLIPGTHNFAPLNILEMNHHDGVVRDIAFLVSF